MIAELADLITSPSDALLSWTVRDWGLDDKKTMVVPNIFEPSQHLVRAPVNRPGSIVTYLGKIEVRKGVIDLAYAAREFLSAVPDAQLRWVGRISPHPADRAPLDVHIRRIVGSKLASRMSFTGGIDYDAISGELSSAAVVVLPSYWENFPYTCLEAMAAGCAVVGSSAGGMAEILVNGKTGMLTGPRDHKSIARAVIDLLGDEKKRAAMGKEARSAVFRRYGSKSIYEQQMAAYTRAVSYANNRPASLADCDARVG